MDDELRKVFNQNRFTARCRMAIDLQARARFPVKTPFSVPETVMTLGPKGAIGWSERQVGGFVGKIEVGGVEPRDETVFANLTPAHTQKAQRILDVNVDLDDLSSRERYAERFRCLQQEAEAMGVSSWHPSPSSSVNELDEKLTDVTESDCCDPTTIPRDHAELSIDSNASNRNPMSTVSWPPTEPELGLDASNPSDDTPVAAHSSISTVSWPPSELEAPRPSSHEFMNSDSSLSWISSCLDQRRLQWAPSMN
ncbi:hypothetical protein BCR34DRAFT_596453 [Clohesyomyces aquaticus]|uniref:Uncharacterized protein n=1 Tax=Clohesyomyces aquaticus TaxID=1231657 RepID=A0A1Y2A6Q1_9PLEO|nr:hypothetical protein BCR34DRAFT_596453 [Clohesyomyces aquaticus]